MKFLRELVKRPPTRATMAGKVADRRLVIIVLSTILIGIVAILAFDLVVNPQNRITLIGTAVLMVVALGLAFFNVLGPGRLLPPTAIFLAITSFILRGGIRDESIMAYATALVVAALLLGKRGALGFGILTAIAVVVVGYREGTGQLTSNLEPVGLADALTVGIILLATSVLLLHLISRLENALKTARQNEQTQAATNQELMALKGDLEARVNQRTAQLQAVNEIARAANASLNPDDLVERVVNLITEKFGYYYAALFILDASNNWADLKNASGAAGRILVQNRHRLDVNGRNMVGAAIRTRTARVAMDVGAEAVRFENPLLPNTRSEIALPLIAGDRVMGALDVQSIEEAAFGEQEIETLQGMANQVAIGLENARLYQETQQSLKEINAMYRQYMSTSWNQIAVDEDLEYNAGDQTESSMAHAIEVPMALRETTIGNIIIESEDDFGPEERSIIEAVAAQTALALENARLLGETQKLAVREHTASEITSKIWAATTIDSILQTAIKELGQALNATDGSIELKLE